MFGGTLKGPLLIAVRLTFIVRVPGEELSHRCHTFVTYLIKFTGSRKSLNWVTIIVTADSRLISVKDNSYVVLSWFWWNFSPLLWFLLFPSGLWEAFLLRSGWLQAWNSQALMVKYVQLKHTQFHMRIWLYRGWCSWLFNLSESLLDSRKTKILSDSSGHRVLHHSCRKVLTVPHWSAEELGLTWDTHVRVICDTKMSLIAGDWWQLCLVCDSSQWYVDVLELNTIILQNI